MDFKNIKFNGRHIESKELKMWDLGFEILNLIEDIEFDYKRDVNYFIDKVLYKLKDYAVRYKDDLIWSSVRIEDAMLIDTDTALEVVINGLEAHVLNNSYDCREELVLLVDTAPLLF